MKLILKYKDNFKKTWDVIKESIGKEKCSQQNFTKKIVMNNKNIANVELIAENFNKYFNKIAAKLAREIETSSIKFDKYISKYNVT